MFSLKKNLEAREQRKYLLSLFYDGAKPNKHLYIAAFIFQAISVSLTDVISPLIVSKILITLSKGGTTDTIETYKSYIYALVALEVFGLAFRRAATFLEERFDAKSRINVVTTIFSKLLEQPASFHQNRFVGSTIALISKCADCFGRTCGMSLFTVLPLVVIFIGTGIIMLPRLPLYFLAVVVVGIAYTIIVAKRLPNQMRLTSNASKEVTRMFGAMSDAISNIAAVKAESGEEIEKEKVKAIGKISLERNLEFSKRVLIYDSFLANSINRSLRVFSVLFAVLVAVEGNGDISNLYLATTLTLSILTYLWSFGDTLFDVTVYFGDAAPIVPILMADVVIQDEHDAGLLENAKGKIEFDKIGYRYPNTNQDVFSDLSLTINEGERVGIVGKSGAGKSTLVKLIMRFVDPTSGDIKIDSISTRSITQESLRNNIAYVAQEPMLFHRSVYQNITYGSDGINDQEVRNVLERAHAHEFIEELPEGIDSIVGERGVNLSGGQRQRIAIARAMLKNAPILILDEATSSLDSESEGFVQAAFEELMRDRTTIVIAHRLSTLLNMDRIVVFDKGRIVEEGTHQELVENNGIYAGLWEHQAGGFLGQQ